MGLKMGGYICDRCGIVVVQMQEELYGALIRAADKDIVIRIFCADCGDTVERAENYMKLKDVGRESNEQKTSGN